MSPWQLLQMVWAIRCLSHAYMLIMGYPWIVCFSALVLKRGKVAEFGGI